jgi:hypothetical protein
MFFFTRRFSIICHLFCYDFLFLLLVRFFESISACANISEQLNSVNSANETVNLKKTIFSDFLLKVNFEQKENDDANDEIKKVTIDDYEYMALTEKVKKKFFLIFFQFSDHLAVYVRDKNEMDSSKKILQNARQRFSNLNNTSTSTAATLVQKRKRVVELEVSDEATRNPSKFYSFFRIISLNGILKLILIYQNQF